MDKKDVDALGATDLFAGLPTDVLEKLAAASACLSLAGNELLLNGDQGDSYDVYVVLEGRISIFQQGHSDGDTVLGEIGPQDLFGEFAAISGRPGWASAKAIAPSVVVKIPRADFLAILGEHPNVSLKLLQKLIGLIHDLDERIVALSADQASATKLRKLFLSTL